MLIENDIELKLVRKVKSMGGLIFKFVAPGTKGVPDRIILYRGKTYFVETKKPGENPRPDQLYIHRKFEEQGIKVYVVNTLNKVNAFIEMLQGGY